MDKLSGQMDKLTSKLTETLTNIQKDGQTQGHEEPAGLTNIKRVVYTSVRCDIFRVFDRNGDGVISKEELRLCITNYGQRLPEEDLEVGTVHEEDLQVGTIPENDLEVGIVHEEDIQVGTLQEEDLEVGIVHEEDLQVGTLPEEDLEVSIVYEEVGTIPEEDLEVGPVPEEDLEAGPDNFIKSFLVNLWSIFIK